MKLIFIHIFLLAILFPGCASNSKTDLNGNPSADLDPDLLTNNVLPITEEQLNPAVEKYFVLQEYKLTHPPEPETPSEWEKQQFNMKFKAGFSVKSKNQSSELGKKHILQIFVY